jgi:hypothetical protein
MKRVALFVMLWLSFSVASARWLQIATAEDFDHYVDLDSVRVMGDFRHLWAVDNLKKPGLAGERSRLDFEEYDCGNLSYRCRSLSFYSGPMATGRLFWRSTRPDQWRWIPPNTVASFKFDALCGD